MGRDQDETPRGNREPTPMMMAIGLARVEERLKGVVQRMDEREAAREDRQDERDAAFRTAMEAVIVKAVSEAVAPLDARVKVLETTKVKLAAIAGAAGAAIPVLWTLFEKFLG